MSLALLLKLCCVCWITIPSVLGSKPLPDQLVHQAIKESIARAKAELDQQHAINVEMYHLGIDGNKRQRSHLHQINMKSQMMASEAAGAGFVVARASQLLSKMLGKSVQQLKAHKNVQALWQAQISHICSPRRPRCKKSRYRTIDGSCNNLFHPTWGMSNRPQKRFISPAYSDGASMPRMFSVTGKPLPSPRHISNVVHQNYKSELREHKDSVMVMQFGQLLDHDFADTPQTTGYKNVKIRCCQIPPKVSKKRASCFPIAVPPHDKRFKGCMDFSRTVASASDYCEFGKLEQLNRATGYVDASYIYGTTFKDMANMRSFKHGLLKMNMFGMPPPDMNQAKCIHQKPQDYCTKTGDSRVHIVPGMASLQIVFMREHNRIAPLLGSLNPHWDDERIFQETRKIIAALNQKISYNEYLPIILGPDLMHKFGLFSREKGFHTAYNPKLDATLANSFAAAAFRFGHSQITNIFGEMLKNGKRRDVRMQDVFNRPGPLTADGAKGPDNVNRWLMNVRGAKSDRIVDSSARDYMFQDEEGNSFDLAAVNIQRGRDHGLPGYNKWRKFCGLHPAFHFAHGPGGLVDIDPKAAMLLSKVYSHPDDIDLFTGGLSEMHVPGGRVGPTFACIIAQQFHEWKFGDRFWYENNFPKTGFTKSQLNEIKKVGFSSVLCNTMKEHAIQPNVFKIPCKENPRVPCGALPQMDLRAWLEGPFAKYR